VLALGAGGLGRACHGIRLSFTLEIEDGIRLDLLVVVYYSVFFQSSEYMTQSPILGN